MRPIKAVVGGISEKRHVFREAREEAGHPNKQYLEFYAVVDRYGQR